MVSAEDMIVQWVQIWMGYAFFSVNLRVASVRLQPVLHDARTLRIEKWGLSWLKQNNFVIFRYISTKLREKVYTIIV